MKRNLLKVIGISFLIFFVLSWVIPTGTYSNGKLTTDSIAPVGLVDLFSKPMSAIVTFALYGLVFAVIGGFYGVVSKTGVLDKVTTSWSKAFEDKSDRLVVITIVLFTLLSSLTGLVIPLFVLVPLFAATLFKLNYDKVTVLASTVGAIMVGSIGSTYGFNITGYTKNLLSLDMGNQIWARISLLVLLTILLCVIVVRSSKKVVKEVKKEKKTFKEEVKKTSKSAKKDLTSKTVKKQPNKKSYKKKSNTKNMAISKSVKKVSSQKTVSSVPFAIIFILMIILTFVGMYNWYYSFGIGLFNDFHEAVMKVKISDFAIFENLLSGVSQFGYWSNIDFASLLVFVSMLLALIYKLSVNEYVESFIAGMKKWMPTAIYVCLANVILVVLYQAMQSGGGTLVDTINGNLFKMADGFNPVITAIATFISSFFYNDLYYLLASITSYTSSFSKTDLKIAGVLIQSIYASAMLLLPVSTTLIAGLSIFDVKYGNWIKYIWKFALIAILIVTMICGILILI